MDYNLAIMGRLAIFVRNMLSVFGGLVLLMMLLTFIMHKRIDFYLSSASEIPLFERVLMAATAFWSRFWFFVTIMFFWIGFGVAGVIELLRPKRKDMA